MTQELIKFPSYSLSSVNAQALQGEVDSMLGKGTRGEVENPGLDITADSFMYRRH